MSARQYILGAAAAVAVGVGYVLIHEHRRKVKKEKERLQSQPVSKEKLVEILQEASTAANEFAEQIATWVAKMQQEHGLTEERAAQVRQQRFEAALDEVINKIRQKKGISEKMMDLAFREYMEDKDVQAALGNIRRQIAPTLAGRQEKAPVRVPQSLTKEKLKEIMVFNAVQLERELAPIKAQLEQAKKTAPEAQINPQVLVDLQLKISEAVKARFGYSDEQVMAAVDGYKAKQDPSFREVLARITNTLNSCLGQAAV